MTPAAAPAPILFSISLLIASSASTSSCGFEAVIKDPRPSEDIALFYAKKTHAYNLLNSQQYGMPSGHAQNLFYSSIFILLTLKNGYISAFYFLLTLISLCQRILFKYHTPLQIVIGCIIGMIIGYTTYNLTTKKIAQNTNIKDDKHSISKYVNN